MRTFIAGLAVILGIGWLAPSARAGCCGAGGCGHTWGKIGYPAPYGAAPSGYYPGNYAPYNSYQYVTFGYPLPNTPLSWVGSYDPRGPWLVAPNGPQPAYPPWTGLPPIVPPAPAPHHPGP